MKVIFIADDRERKRTDIFDTLERLYPKAKIVESTCGRGILNDMTRYFAEEVQNNPDECLAIIDMQMPKSLQQSIDINCGYFVLSSMQVNEMKIPAIIVSSERIDDNRAREYYDHFAGSILYQSYCDQIELYKRTLDRYFKKKRP